MLADRRANLSFNQYSLPGANKADWKEILSLLDKKVNPGTGRAAYVTTHLEAFISSITNDSLAADYEATMHKLVLITRYQIANELRTHCCQLPGHFDDFLRNKILEAINFPGLKPEDKLALIKAYTLHTGIDDSVLAKFTMTPEERAEVRKYYNEELVKFMFYYNFDHAENFKNYVGAVQDVDELREIAFKVIGSRLLRSSISADIDPSMVPITEMKKQLSELLTNGADIQNLERAKALLFELTDRYIEYFQDRGFSRYAKCPINPINYYFSDKMSGGRRPWTSLREVQRENYKPEDIIHIVHGGGFYSILSFLKKEFDGYHLDNPGVGLQVHPYTDTGNLKGNVDSFEDRTRGDYAIKSAHFIDIPARLTADVPAGAIDRSHRYYEGGLRSKNLDKLTNLTFTNYITGKVYRGDNVSELIHNIENRIEAPAVTKSGP